MLRYYVSKCLFLVSIYRIAWDAPSCPQPNAPMLGNLAPVGSNTTCHIQQIMWQMINFLIAYPDKALQSAGFEDYETSNGQDYTVREKHCHIHSETSAIFALFRAILSILACPSTGDSRLNRVAI